MKNKVAKKCREAMLVIGFSLVLALFLSVSVFAAMAAAKYAGLYDNMIALGLIVSLAVSTTLVTGMIKVS